MHAGVGPGEDSLGEIGLRDVIRAWRLLGAVTDDERRAIARTLGFDLRAATPTTSPGRTPTTLTPEPGGTGGTAVSPAVQSVTEEPQPIELVPFTDVEINPIELPAVGLPRPVEVESAVLEPLFTLSWSRAIASTLTERAAPVGPIDVERTIELLARRMPIARLPRRDRLVSATEIAVVVDRRGTLAWFRDDAALLLERLDAVTRAQVTVLESDGAPILASAMSERDPERSAPPAAAAGDDAGGDGDSDIDDRDDAPPLPDRVRVGAQGRVIGITDLGRGSPWTRGDPARADAWADLAIALRARGASLVIVTPVPAERIPPRLVRLTPCIYWDRSTRPGLVHRLIKALT